MGTAAILLSFVGAGCLAAIQLRHVSVFGLLAGGAACLAVAAGLAVASV